MARLDRTLLAAGGLGAAMLVSGNAAAQDANAPVAVYDNLIACRSIAASAERLACFDRASAALEAAREKKEVVVLDRDSVRKAKRGLFGFSLPKIKLFGGSDDDEPELDQIDSKLTEARTIARDLWLLKLEDGTAWQTTEMRASFMPRSGATVNIKAGGLGSYTARVEGERPIKVKRIR